MPRIWQQFINWLRGTPDRNPLDGRAALTPTKLSTLSVDIANHARGVHELAERADYLTVAVMRGDPRFAKAEYAKEGFDSDAFDAWWRSKGKRVPSMEEIFG